MIRASKLLTPIDTNMIVFLIIVGVILLHICFAVIELGCLRVTNYRIDSSKMGTAGRLRIAVLSDIHCCKFGKNNEKLLKMLYGTNPDVIVISGDLINGMDSKEVSYGEEFLKKLKKNDIPVIYEYGNHEERLKNRDEEAFNKYTEMARQNSILLRNTTYKVNDEISITGLDLPEYMYRRGDFTVNLEEMCRTALNNGNLEADRFKIVVAHDPSHFELYVRAGADLVISGHYHGGIMRLPFVGGLVSPKLEFFPKYTKGLYYCKDSVMCLSAGIGWHNLPIRFMNRPEIVVIDLEGKD